MTVAVMPTHMEVEVDVVVRSVRFTGDDTTPTVEDLARAMAMADGQDWPMDDANQLAHYRSYAMRVLRQLRSPPREGS